MSTTLPQRLSLWDVQWKHPWEGSRFFEPLRRAGATFAPGPERTAIVTAKGIRAVVRAEEVLFVLHEIVVGGTYDLHFDYPAVVWDVGMNRGLASLYFAQHPNVVAVRAYEPFRPTYRQAQENLALNPRLARKVTAFNIGIGGTGRAIRTGYCPDWTGNMRVDGVPRWLAEDPTVTVVQEKVTLQDATVALDELGAAYPGLPIIAKIDCEGSEYEIVRALHRSGRLERIQVILMEWHLEGPGELTAALVEAGFTVFPQRTLPDRGMLYAVRSAG